MTGVDLFGFLAGISPWAWITLGVALGALEMVTVSFLLMWPGLAAIVVGVLLFAIPDLDGTAQVLIFAALSALFTLGGRMWMARHGEPETDNPTLNRRNQRVEGRRGKALEAFAGGEGPVEVDGVRWTARLADGAAPPGEGDAVRVRAVEGMTLVVEPED